MDIKKILLKRGLSFYFILIALVLVISTFVLYITNGVNEFTPSLDSKVVSVYIVAIVIAVICCLVEVKLGKYALFVLTFWAWLEYLISQANYLSNVLVAIDGTQISATFVLTALFGFVALALFLVSAICQKNEIGSY